IGERAVDLLAGGETALGGREQLRGTLQREQVLTDCSRKRDVGQRHVNNLSGLTQPGLLGRTRGTLGILWSTKDEAARVMVNRACAFDELWLTDGQNGAGGLSGRKSATAG